MQPSLVGSLATCQPNFPAVNTHYCAMMLSLPYKKVLGDQALVQRQEAHWFHLCLLSTTTHVLDVQSSTR